MTNTKHPWPDRPLLANTEEAGMIGFSLELTSGFFVFAGAVRDRNTPIVVALLSQEVDVVPGGIFLGLGNTDELHARTPDIFVLGQD
jgi:hypothetical protein